MNKYGHEASLPSVGDSALVKSWSGFRAFAVVPALLIFVSLVGVLRAGETIDLANHRELFADKFLIQSMTGATLMLHEPRDEGVAFKFDLPWEGAFSAYCTVIHDGNHYRLYYRGKASGKGDGVGEDTCVADSDDGLHWVKPKLGIVEIDGNKENNAILKLNDLSHNFSPFLDENPAGDPKQKFKAIAGSARTGLIAFTSPDGLHWEKLREAPVLNRADLPYHDVFDSQNLVFWSVLEKRYVMFFRVYKDKMRRIARAESDDFVNWKNVQLMEYRGADGKPTVIEHLYTSQTHPYFRAPQLYVSLAARFMLGRQVITEEEAKAINVHPSYFKDTSDAIFMTSRGGNIYDRTFLGAFVRPGIGAHNWVSRTTYPALNVVQTGPTEMSAYVNQDYAQPTAHVRRYSMRLDGFASVRAPYEGGEMVTKPFTFQGDRLMLNFATSAAGGIKVEIQNAAGEPVPVFTLADSTEVIGNEIERSVKWKGNDDVSRLAGQPIRLRFVMKDADIYALQFTKKEPAHSSQATLPGK